MRATRIPGVQQTTMTCEQNLSRCESASTERYDYREDVCPACKKEDRKKEKESRDKIHTKREFRAKERADLMKRDYDNRQNMVKMQARIATKYAEIEKKRKGAKDKEAVDMRENAERQYRAQGLSQQRISQLLWSDEERREWEQKEEERLAKQRGMEKTEKEPREKGEEEERRH
jgi:hypothetical protein